MQLEARLVEPHRFYMLIHVDLLAIHLYLQFPVDEGRDLLGGDGPEELSLLTGVRGDLESMAGYGLGRILGSLQLAVGLGHLLCGQLSGLFDLAFG